MPAPNISRIRASVSSNFKRKADPKSANSYDIRSPQSVKGLAGKTKLSLSTLTLRLYISPSFREKRPSLRRKTKSAFHPTGRRLPHFFDWRRCFEAELARNIASKMVVSMYFQWFRTFEVQLSPFAKYVFRGNYFSKKKCEREMADGVPSATRGTFHLFTGLKRVREGEVRLPVRDRLDQIIEFISHSATEGK